MSYFSANSDNRPTLGRVLRSPRRVATSLAYPSPPKGFSIYAIGDIHGRLDLLNAAFERIDADHATYPTSDRVEIYLGDLVDRGPDSCGVIEALIERQKKVALGLVRGNHEILFEGFLGGEIRFAEWKRCGGAETLLSYGVPAHLISTGARVLADVARTHVPQSHLVFLSQARPYIKLADYCFVHAGLRPGIALEAQKIEDLAWIRKEFTESAADFGMIVVHGHTPAPLVDCRLNRIGIDTGAYITNRLSVLVIDDQGAALVEADDGEYAP